MKVIIFTCFFVLAASASLLEDQVEKFQSFKLNYSKTYLNHFEESKRFNIFKKNLQSIDQHNALYEQGLASYKQGVNKFTDMTQEEFKAMLTFSSSNRPQLNTTKHMKIAKTAIPDSVDWRTKGQVTGVKDQGFCGSCWAFSLTGSTEAAYYRKSGKLVSLSEQQLVDCSTDINDGCSGGYLDQSFPYIEKYGLQSEDSYPYTGMDGTCKYSANNVVAIVSTYKAITSEDEDALLDAVVNVGPISVALDASRLSSYSSGIYDDAACTEQLDHAVLAVGYGTENDTPYWIVKNSWGDSWGEKGYFRIKRGCNQCGIAKDTVYPTCN